jgi:hypothetical protein
VRANATDESCSKASGEPERRFNLMQINQAEIGKVAAVSKAMEKIKEVSTRATDSDRVRVRELIDPSKGIRFERITPEVGAVLFLEHNGHNRDFRPSKAELFARDIEAGRWHRHHQGIAFRRDGNLGDGQHRCAAVALGGKAIELAVMGSFDDAAIEAIDNGVPRKASDAAQLEGIENARQKETVWRAVRTYERDRVGAAQVASVPELKAELHEQNAILTDAIEIGEASVKNVTIPVLSASEAAVFAMLFMRHNWPRHRVVEMLAAFQQGNFNGEGHPLFKAGTRIAASKQRKTERDKLSHKQMMGLVVKAFCMTAEGKIAVRNISFDRKEPLPDPTWPNGAVE